MINTSNVKNTNCEKCNKQLLLSNFKGSKWNNLVEEFSFLCDCGHVTIFKTKLFNQDQHINQNYLNSLKEKPHLLQDDVKQAIAEHIKDCQHCKDSFEVLYLKDVEEKINYDDTSLKFFKHNSKKILKKLEDTEVFFIEENDKTHISSFTLENKQFFISKEDEFYRQKKKFLDIENVEEVFCHVKDGPILISMVSFLIINGTISIGNIWFKSDEKIQFEKNWFRKNIENKNIKLATIKNIMGLLK